MTKDILVINLRKVNFIKEKCNILTTILSFRMDRNFNKISKRPALTTYLDMVAERGCGRKSG